MGRQIALVVVSATIYAVLACGCGPRDAAQTVQGGSPVTLEVKAGQTPAGNRPVTRAEVFDWWDAGVRNSRSLTTADIKSKYGLPDTTYEKEFTANATGTLPHLNGQSKYRVLVYRYNKLTVDAAGSGKTDSATLFMFELEGKQNWRPVEFIP